MNKIVSAVIGTVVIILSIWFTSPYVALRGIQQAIVENNAAQASEYIDYDKLRSNAKIRVRTYAQEAIGKQLPKIVSSALASMAYGTLDTAIDAYVTPETLEKLSQTKTTTGTGQITSTGEPKRSWDVRWWTKRQSLDEIHLYIASNNPTYSDREVVVRLQRVSGLTWKIVDIDPNGWKQFVLSKMRERMAQR